MLGEQEQEDVEISNMQEIEQAEGNLKIQTEDEKLMHSVLENDQDKIDDGKILNEAINQGMASFTPDLMFEQFVNNYSLAENIYGESLLNLLSGYDSSYIKRNIKIPEFQREMKDKINQKLDEMKKEKILNNDYSINDKGLELASLVMYVQELDKLVPKGSFGERMHKKSNQFGLVNDYRNYKKGDLYKDLAIKKSVKTAVRRGHSRLEVEDLKTFERESKGQVYVIYAIDASGSMKGKKIEAGKKAGIALAHKAIENKDKVGLVVFGEEIKTAIEPTHDFSKLLREFARIVPKKETDLALTITKALQMFPSINVTKHLVLLTDALPTKGKMPEQETLEAVSGAKNFGVTVSLVGLGLDKQGEKLGKRMVEIGEGKFYIVKTLDNVDKILLEDYYSVA